MQARLRALPGVTVVPRDDKLKYRHAHSRIWNETWLAAFFHKPCNHELFVLQSLNMEGAASAVALSIAMYGHACNAIAGRGRLCCTCALLLLTRVAM